MLSTGELYNELGHDWFEKRNSPERRARRHLAELGALGWQLDLHPGGDHLGATMRPVTFPGFFTPEQELRIRLHHGSLIVRG